MLAEQTDEAAVGTELFAHRSFDEFEAVGIALERFEEDPFVRSQGRGGLRHRGAG